jgi:hypothetical protein
MPELAKWPMELDGVTPADAGLPAVPADAGLPAVPADAGETAVPADAGESAMAETPAAPIVTATVSAAASLLTERLRTDRRFRAETVVSSG